MKMTPKERKDAKEFSEASRLLRTKEGWVAYQSARMSGKGHYEALDLGFSADFAAFRK